MMMAVFNELTKTTVSSVVVSFFCCTQYNFQVNRVYYVHLLNTLWNKKHPKLSAAVHLLPTDHPETSGCAEDFISANRGSAASHLY